MVVHPAEYWIKFLLSRKEHTFDEIEGMLEMAGLGASSSDYLVNLRAELREDEPVPFRPHDPRHKASGVYLRRHGIYDAWNRTRFMRAAVDLLANDAVRPLLETFILSPLKPKQAIHKIHQNTGFKVEPRTYELFQHFFWNPSLLSAEEWGDFIQRRRVAHQEWLRLAVTSKGPQGVQLLLWKTGSGPTRHLDAVKIFTHLRNVAYFKAVELEHLPAGKDHSIAFSNYVKSAKQAQEEVAASSAAMVDVLDSFKAFQMKTMEEQVPSIMELTDGGVEGTFSEAEDVDGEENKIRMDDY